MAKIWWEGAREHFIRPGSHWPLETSRELTAFQVRTVLVLKERQAAILALQHLLENKITNAERLPALQSTVPSLAQSSVEKVKNSEDLFKDLEENSNTGLQLLLSSEASSPVRGTCVAIVKRLVQEKVG